MLKTALAFTLLHARFQLPSIIIVDVTAVGKIIRVGLMLPPYAACSSASTDRMGHCGLLLVHSEVAFIGSNSLSHMLYER